MLVTKRIDLSQKISRIEVSWIFQRPDLTPYSPASRRQIPSGFKPSSGRRGAPALQEMRAESEQDGRSSFIGFERNLTRRAVFAPRNVTAVGALVSPISDGIEVDLLTHGGVSGDAGCYLASGPINSETPRIARTAVLGRPNDVASLIDPHSTRHVGHSVEIRHYVPGIDQARVVRLCRSYPLSSYPCTAGIERHRNHNETVPQQLFVKFLPDRQVISTASPRCPREEQHLRAAEVAQPMLDADKVWKRELWRHASDRSPIRSRDI